MGIFENLLKRIKGKKSNKGKSSSTQKANNGEHLKQTKKKQRAVSSTIESSYRSTKNVIKSTIQSTPIKNSTINEGPSTTSVLAGRTGGMQTTTTTTTTTTPAAGNAKPTPPKVVSPKVIRGGSTSTLDLSKELSSPHLVPSSPVSNVYDKIYDCIALLIHCPAHNRIAVAKSPTEALWLPYVQYLNKTARMDSARDTTILVLANGNTHKYEFLRRNPPYEHIQLLDIYRIQMPNTRKFVTRFTFYVRLKMPNQLKLQTEQSKSTKGNRNVKSHFTCCTDTTRLVWSELDFIAQGCIQNCWGPELVEFGRQIMAATKAVSEQTSPQDGPYLLRQRLQEFGIDEIYEILPRKDGPAENGFRESLKNNKVSNADIEHLYSDFLDHCFPSFYMTYDSFRHYMIKNSFEINDIRLKRLFQAFNTNQNGYISFNEMLIGLVSIERETPHVEFRIKFVFDYYDTKRRGLFFEEEMSKLVRDLNSDRDCNLKCSENDLVKRTREAFSCFRTKQVQGRTSISYTAFLNGIGTHAFRGTSTLCRSRKNIFLTISRRITARTMKTNFTKGKLGEILYKRKYQGSCKSCQSRQYKIASHMSILTLDGYYDHSEPLELSFTTAAPASSSQMNSTSVSHEGMQQSTMSMQSLGDCLINETVGINSTATTLMSKIREFNKVKPKNFTFSERMPGVMNQLGDREHLVQMIRNISDELLPLLKKEARCKPVSSPVYVIGDIHGNLEDLISMERTLWRRFPEINGIHYLFLGDYVDRGRWSVECALYLISMKLLKPNCITLLRGNHEVRDIQMKYTYKRECFAKYGEEYGHRIWDLTNRIFDHFPLCAIVDEQVGAKTP